jgi:hypothetical protein
MVIPIWTVDNIFVGFCDNSRATFALLLPRFIALSSLNFLDETNDISARENKPFNKIKTIIINISIINFAILI